MAAPVAPFVTEAQRNSRTDCASDRAPIRPRRGGASARLARPSGPVILFQPPQSLQKAVAFSWLVAIDRQLFDRFAGRGSVVLLPLERFAKDVAQMLGTRKAVGLQLGQAAVAPPGGDLVSGRLAAVRMRASDMNLVLAMAAARRFDRRC